MYTWIVVPLGHRGIPGMTLLSLSVTVAGVAKAGADIIKAGVDIKRAANTEATAAANTRFKNITWASRKIAGTASLVPRSEEHTSELQSRFDLVCRLLLEKKKKIKNNSS